MARRSPRKADLCPGIRVRYNWFNNTRLLEPIGYVPPAEFEQTYYAHAATAEEEERLKQQSLH